MQPHFNAKRQVSEQPKLRAQGIHLNTRYRVNCCSPTKMLDKKKLIESPHQKTTHTEMYRPIRIQNVLGSIK